MTSLLGPEDHSALAERVRRIAGDRTSGASAVLLEVLGVLQAALRRPEDVVQVARDLCRAQPTMAPVWNAAIEAVAGVGEPGRFARFVARTHRAPAALTRVAVDLLTDPALPAQSPAALHVLTLSYSGAVFRALTTLAAGAPVRISCAEGRPALEGRRLVTDLAAAGIPATCYSDAAIGSALTRGGVVLVGADAVGPVSFFNKVGTRMLAAAAAQHGIPVHVLATRDKFVSERLWGQLTVRAGTAAEIWPDAPDGVDVRNPYFEATPLDIVSSVITDAGAIGPADIPNVCAAVLDASARRALTLLLG